MKGKSLKKKAFLGLVVIFCLSASLVIFLSSREISTALTEAEEESVNNIFQLVDLNVTQIHKHLLEDKISAVEQRKQSLLNSSTLAIATFNQLGSSLSAKNAAKQRVLDWISTVRKSSEVDWRIVHRSGEYISHPEPTSIGSSALNIKDLFGRPVVEKIASSLPGKINEFAVFNDPLKGQNKQLGLFHFFPSWDWILVQIVDLGSIELANEREQSKALKELQASFDQIQLPGDGSAFIFNSQLQSLVLPHERFMNIYLPQLESLQQRVIDHVNRSSSLEGEASLVQFEVTTSDSKALRVFASYSRLFDFYTVVALPKAALVQPVIGLQWKLGLLVVVVFVVGLITTFLFIRKISDPLLQLASTMREVSTTGNYALRAQRTTHDEIGQLVDGFNDMLTQIEVRERKLEDHKNNLEHTVFERTLELNETVTSLELAKEKAEAANQAKSNFLSIMTHELRTPLIGVLGMNELLLNTPLTEEQRKLADTARNSGEHLMALISDILDFSKIESNKLTLNPAPINISEITEETTRLLGEAAAQKGLTVTCQISPDVHPVVIADPLRVRQILLNLISNAVKFTFQGEIAIRLGMSPLEAHAGLYTLEVQDTGVGMTAEDQEVMFEPFTQIDTAVNRKAGGTGLGLAIVRQLVELMDGRIDVESHPEKGSLIRVQFSFMLADDQDDGTTAVEQIVRSQPVAPIAPPEQTTIQGGRILIADDYAVTRELVRHHLGPRGFEIDEAVSGQEAIEMAMNNNYGVVLMDCNMPGMDGIEATRQLRERGNTVPIVALTAHVDSQILRDCSEAGMNDSLSKPFRGNALLETVNKWLKEEGREQSE